MFRKRQHCIGLFFPSVVQKKLHARRFQGRNCKVHALPERRCPVDSIKTGSYLITVDFIQRYEMFSSAATIFFPSILQPPSSPSLGFLRQNLLPDAGPRNSPGSQPEAHSPKPHCFSLPLRLLPLPLRFPPEWSGSTPLPASETQNQGWFFLRTAFSRLPTSSVLVRERRFTR